MELSTILQGLAVLNNSQTQQGQQVAGMYNAAAQESTGAASNIQEAGSLAREAELTRLQGELNTQNARVKVANAYGTNVNAVSDIVTGLASNMRQTSIELLAAQDKVAEIESESDLLGNPVGWLKDLLIGDEFRAKRDALQGKLDTQSKVAHSLNSATQTGIATQNAISETLTQSSITQLADLKMKSAEVDAARQRIEGYKYGAAGIQASIAVEADVYNRGLQAFNLVEGQRRWEQQFAAMEEQRAFQREQTEYMRSVRKDEQAAKVSEAQMWQDTTDRVNAYRQTFGGPAVTTAQVKRDWTSPKFGEQLREEERSGHLIIESNQTGSMAGVLGTSAFETYGRVVSGSVQLPPSWKGQEEFLTTAALKLQTSLEEIDPKTGKKMSAGMSPEAIKNSYDAIILQDAQVYNTDIKKGTGNIYEAPPIPSVLEFNSPTVQRLKNSPFGEEVLGSLVGTGIADPEPALIAATALKQVDAGKITMNDAVTGIKDFYAAALQVRQATGGFDVLNVPATRSYNVSARQFFPGAPNLRVEPSGVVGKAGKWFGQNYVPVTPLDSALKALSSNKEYVPQLTFNLTDEKDVATALSMMKSKDLAAKLTQAMQEGNE